MAGKFDLSQKIFSYKEQFICGNGKVEDDAGYSGIPHYAYLLFDDICDIIGPADEWPTVIRNLFWTPACNHWNRMKLVAFIVVNGLHPELFMDWVDLMGLAGNISARREFVSWINELTSNEFKWHKIYAFNVLNHQYEYVTGEIKFRLALNARPS